MTKLQIRILKNHYLARWEIMRHNQKNNDKILLFIDKFILENLINGTTLCYNCLEDVYQGIIPNLIYTNNNCNNVVLINNIEFKYKTLEELSEYIKQISSSLLPGGRLIFSFEHKFLIYDRVNMSVTTALKHFTNKFDNFSLVRSLNLLGKSQPGYGDYLFCFTKNE
jgi:hypothetical protein